MTPTRDRIFSLQAKQRSRGRLTYDGILIVEEGRVLPQHPLDAGEVAGARDAVNGLDLGRPRPRAPVLAPRHLLPPPLVDLHGSTSVCVRPRERSPCG